MYPPSLFIAGNQVSIIYFCALIVTVSKELDLAIFPPFGQLLTLVGISMNASLEMHLIENQCLEKDL